ncbi:MAG: hypothetical protein KDB80_05780 [Planctomycetes bacterium]|nr:hypothetical protein [Planctomycetota bacterium]
MNTRAPLVSIVAAGFLCTAAIAQVTMTATANAFEATGNSIPAGTDVTSGTVVSGGPSLVQFQSARTSAALTAQLRSNIFVPSPMGGHPAYWTTSEVDLALTSAVPIPVDVVVAFDLSGALLGAGGSVLASVAGEGTADAANPTLAFSTTLDATGIVIDLDMSSFAGAVPSGQFSFVSYELIANVTVTPTNFATSYGDTCGVTLEATASLDAPQHTITIADPTASYGILVIGTQQAVIPLSIFIASWTCTLRTDILVSIPVPVGPPSGSFSFPFGPPPGTFTMQALTVASTNVNTSNGLEFVR